MIAIHRRTNRILGSLPSRLPIVRPRGGGVRQGLLSRLIAWFVLPEPPEVTAAEIALRMRECGIDSLGERRIGGATCTTQADAGETESDCPTGSTRAGCRQTQSGKARAAGLDTAGSVQSQFHGRRKWHR